MTDDLPIPDFLKRPKEPPVDEPKPMTIDQLWKRRKVVMRQIAAFNIHAQQKIAAMDAELKAINERLKTEIGE